MELRTDQRTTVPEGQTIANALTPRLQAAVELQAPCGTTRTQRRYGQQVSV